MDKQLQTYRVNVKLRRRGQPALDYNRLELKSESFDSDEDFCLAVASELMEILQEDRDFLEGLEND